MADPFYARPRARGRLIRVVQRLDNSWVGDLIGGVCLAATIVLLVIFAGVLS
ncbi:MAG: hypothetical protein ACK4HW_08405 [Roseinatronobacter sp.]